MEDEKQVVYLIVGGGYAKIGTTKNLESRLSSLQSGNPHPLGVYGTIPGGVAVEGGMHKKFADKHVRGEWFTDSEEIRAEFPALNQPGWEPRDRNTGGRPLKGATPRNTVIRMLVEQWAKQVLLDDAAPGESQADVITRWAAEKRDAKAGA